MGQKDPSRKLSTVLISTVAILMSVAALTILFVYRFRGEAKIPVDSICVENLRTAHHVKSTFPAQSQTVYLIQKAGLRSATLNSIGMEPRDVRAMATGEPENVFQGLSHMGGFGEILWVDQWSNFPIKLPPTTTPGSVVVPRREAVQAALDAIEASGGCLIKAGEGRCLIVKASEKSKYEAAIRALGWLNGKDPPWAKAP